MKKIVDNYNLERITSRMSQKFGTIYKGTEAQYALILMSMESNMLKLHRAHPECVENHATTAIQMCLLDIDGFLRGIEYDYDRFVTDEVKILLHGLKMSFDPFTNPEIHVLVKDIFDIESVEEMREYFETFVKCLIRIQKSIELWSGHYGINGYFNFMESMIGGDVKNDGIMNYTMLISDVSRLDR